MTTCILKFPTEAPAASAELFKDIVAGFSVWQDNVARSDARSHAFHELSVIAAGEAELITSDGWQATIRAGEAIVIPAGVEHRWTNEVPALRNSARLLAEVDPSKDTPIHIVPDLDHTFRPSQAPSPDRLIGPVPQQEACQFFSNASGNWHVGLWRSTSYHRIAVPFPKHELMFLTGGDFVLNEDNGTPHPFEKGDTMFIAGGSVADWVTPGMSKIYCIYEDRK